MNGLIKGKSGGFFTPQDEGGKCKLTIIFEEREAQDAAFLMRYKDVVIGLADQSGIDIPAPAITEAHGRAARAGLEALNMMLDIVFPKAPAVEEPKDQGFFDGTE